MITVNTHILEEKGKSRTYCGEQVTPAMSVEKFGSLLTYYIDTNYKGLCPLCKQKYLLMDLHYSPVKVRSYSPTLPHRM